MLVLGIETSAILCSVAWVREKHTLLEYNIEIANIHATTLPDLVHEGVKRLKIPISEIDIIAVGAGPGSFTGLRIGMAYAKGLGFALEKPVVGVTNFHVLAYQAIQGARPIFAVIDARRDNYYVGEFKKNYLTLDSTHFLSRQKLKDLIGENALIVTPIKNFVFNDTKKVSVLSLRYSAAIVALLGEEQFTRQGAEEIDQLEPLYLQKFAGVTG